MEVPVRAEVLLEQLVGDLPRLLDARDDVAMRAVGGLEILQQRVEVLEGAIQRRRLDGLAGVEQLRHLLGVQHRGDHVAAQRDILDQAGALEGDHRLAHGRGRHLEIPSETVDAQPRPRGPAGL